MRRRALARSPRSAPRSGRVADASPQLQPVQLDGAVDTTTTSVFVAVVGGRFLLPLLIPYYPLPGVVSCLILDGADETIFQVFGQDPPSYQSYDKAMDVFYLSIAYLSTLRNWES